ncbi:MAG: hypothetical protein ACJ8H8_17610 [Geminicoccaceae bacterium]
MNSMVHVSAAIAAFIAGVASSSAADFPKSGNAEYDTYYVLKTVGKLETDVASGGLYDFTGITRNVKGESPFNNMSVHCLSRWTLVGGKFDHNGSCTETDQDGDTVFTTFDSDTHYVIGGTGKYKGITGSAPYSAIQLHETVDGQEAAIVNHKVSWQIK